VASKIRGVGLCNCFLELADVVDKSLSVNRDSQRGMWPEAEKRFDELRKTVSELERCLSDVEGFPVSLEIEEHLEELKAAIGARDKLAVTDQVSNVLFRLILRACNPRPRAT